MFPQQNLVAHRLATNPALYRVVAVGSQSVAVQKHSVGEDLATNAADAFLLVTLDVVLVDLLLEASERSAGKTLGVSFHGVSL